MGRRGLQIAIAIVASIPVTTGGLALFFGIRSPLYTVTGACVTPLLDSNFRFMAGVWFGLGLAAYWLIPNIERQTTVFRVIWGVIFLGGLGRMISLFALGLPAPLYAAFMVVELLGAPTFIYWQSRVAKTAGTAWGAKVVPATTAPPA